MSEKATDYKVTEHQLFISPLRLWMRLRRQNSVSAKSRWMRVKITMLVLISAPFRWLQKVLIARRIKGIDLKNNPPVFVIGHWRSGTTHLHYLLAQDKQFSHLTAFQAFFFHVAFVSKSVMKPLLHLMMPSTRPQDGVKIDSDSPTEEEHCLSNCTEKCGMQSFFFPQNRTYFDKYNLFEGISARERRSWMKIYNKMLKKIALYEGLDKKLLLKNPHNTGRIEALIELYPKAKFIFIHRDPYEVFSSTKILYDKTIKSQFLQNFTDDEIEERIVYAYEKTLSKYLSTKELIPQNQLVEVSFADLDNEPLRVMRDIYQELGLGDFDQLKPALENYLASLKNFKKNTKAEIPSKRIEQINVRWKFAFDEWNYELRNA